jgi:phosphatidylinositol 3-kinase
MPLDPRVSVTSIRSDKSSVFKSNLLPLLLWFEREKTEEDDEMIAEPGYYPIIFKNGDDLRQDQLVIQLFNLMDRLLRKENLDLRLSPYSVLATSTAEGMIQFVESQSLGAIMAEYGSLQAYLRKHNADPGALGTYGIEANVMDTYVRSCGKLETKYS